MTGAWYHRRQHRDRNHLAIMRALESYGVLVADLSGAGGGVPDLLCGYRGMMFTIEVKTPTGSLSKAQRAWFDEWSEYPALVLRSLDDVVHVMGVLRDAYDLAEVDWSALVPRGRRRAKPLEPDEGTRRPTRRRHRGAGLEPGGI
jgi:hypothetical protein